MTAKALVIDDCRMSSLLLRHILRQAGLASDAAATGPEGLAKAQRGGYDLVFLDIVLPGMDGLEVASRLLREQGEKRPRIFLVTALGEDYVPDNVKDLGAEAIFFKPITPSQIARAIKETLAAR